MRGWANTAAETVLPEISSPTKPYGLPRLHIKFGSRFHGRCFACFRVPKHPDEGPNGLPPTSDTACFSAEIFHAKIILGLILCGVPLIWRISSAKNMNLARGWANNMSRAAVEEHTRRCMLQAMFEPNDGYMIYEKPYLEVFNSHNIRNTMCASLLHVHLCGALSDAAT